MSNGFKVIDITFRNARSQSEILKELGEEELKEKGVSIPVSRTPEQIINFYRDKIENTQNVLEKDVYRTTIFFIEEFQRIRKELIAKESKEIKEDDEKINNED